MVLGIVLGKWGMDAALVLYGGYDASLVNNKSKLTHSFMYCLLL